MNYIEVQQMRKQAASLKPVGNILAKLLGSLKNSPKLLKTQKPLVSMDAIRSSSLNAAQKYKQDALRDLTKRMPEASALYDMLSESRGWKDFLYGPNKVTRAMLGNKKLMMSSQDSLREFVRKRTAIERMAESMKSMGSKNRPSVLPKDPQKWTRFGLKSQGYSWKDGFDYGFNPWAEGSIEGWLERNAP